MRDIYNIIAENLYDRYVVNTSAVAIQNEYSKYVSVKTPITVDMICAMLKGGYSLGIYQQQYKKDRLMWLCLDFDTKKKEDNQEELETLKENYVKPFLKELDDKGIKYLVEFSGRRGFHVWIFLSQIITKDLGYSIIWRLASQFYIELLRNENLGLDLFPKTYSGRVCNKYGLQVKIPLSKHQASGTYSYFIDINNFNCERITELNLDFLERQLVFLKSIKTNDVEDLLKVLNLKIVDCEKNHIMFHRQKISTSYSITIDDVRKIFQSDVALEKVWNKIISGNLDAFERIMLLGIFGHITDGESILHELFALQINYNRRITNEMINKYRSRLFPVSFYYLYQHYGIDSDICPKDYRDSFVDDYIFSKLGIEVNTAIVKTDRKKADFLRSVVEKEINYFLYNDEVYNFNVYYQLKNFTYYDYAMIDFYVSRVENGEESVPENLEMYTYIRKEDDKERTLVSLGAKERVITTALINKMIFYLQRDYKSYSYHLNMGMEGDVFYPWISSWTRYKNDISQYFSMPIFSQYHVLKMDIHHFYDSVFLQGVYHSLIQNKKYADSELFINIYSYLSQFNEKVMLNISGGIRGVPQGPAYARVLAELTMDEFVNAFFEQYPEFVTIKLYRYVDDMFAFSLDSKLLHRFLEVFSEYLGNRGLFLNKKKTKMYGMIRDLLPRDKMELQEFRDFNYDIVSLKDTEWKNSLGGEEFESKYLRFIYRRSEWNVNDANLIFSDRIDKSVQNRYLSQFYGELLESSIGRGSVFRKFYHIIFTDSRRVKHFFENRDYLKIPKQSINYENMVCEMILNVQNIVLYIDYKDDWEELKKYLEHLNGQNTTILISLIEDALREG